jgi:hypothetical protein
MDNGNTTTAIPPLQLRMIALQLETAVPQTGVPDYLKEAAVDFIAALRKFADETEAAQNGDK